jgi:hypothetical protein
MSASDHLGPQFKGSSEKVKVYRGIDAFTWTPNVQGNVGSWWSTSLKDAKVYGGTVLEGHMPKEEWEPHAQLGWHPDVPEYASLPRGTSVTVTAVHRHDDSAGYHDSLNCNHWEQTPVEPYTVRA